MKITSVKATLFSYVFDEPMYMKFWGGTRTIVKKMGTVIKLETDEGLVGYSTGEGMSTSPALAGTINEVIGPQMIGEDPLNIDAIWTKSLKLQVPSCLKKGTSKSSSNLLYVAMSLLDIALWDLKGKIEDKPICELLGEVKQDKVRLYASGGMYMPPEGYAEEAASAVKNGFDAYKMRPGVGPESDVKIIEAIKKVVPQDFKIMADAHTWWRMGRFAYSYPVIKRITKQYENLGVYFLEEPLPPEDVTLYRDLRASTDIPIAGGEHEVTVGDVEKLLSQEALDILQPDVPNQGGVTYCKKLCEAVRKAGKTLVFHNFGSGIGTIINAHVMASFSEEEAPWLEFPMFDVGTPGIEKWVGMYDYPAAKEIINDDIEIENGYLRVPRKPGLGIEINEEILEKYPWVPGPWSWFNISSPPMTVQMT